MRDPRRPPVDSRGDFDDRAAELADDDAAWSRDSPSPESSFRFRLPLVEVFAWTSDGRKEVKEGRKEVKEGRKEVGVLRKE
jgi:hypothetical protein